MKSLSDSCFEAERQQDEGKPITACGMSDKVMLSNLLQLRGEADSCNYDEDTAKLHLCIIGKIDCVETARVNYNKIENDNINEWDFVVLWAEMERIHGEKIRKWFPSIREMDFESKILDECALFVKAGKLPYYDLNL